MLPVRLTLNPKNELTAEPTSDSATARALVRFLNGDLAEDAKHCQALLDGGAEILAGKKTSWQLSGNAYGLTLTAQTTELRTLATKEAAVSVPTREFLDLVAQWLGLLGRPAVT